MRFEHIIGEDYFKMVKNVVKIGRVPNGVMKGLIHLTFKYGDKYLRNWWLISLLNKIFAKALQIYL
jgi:hypothetical protein